MLIITVTIAPTVPERITHRILDLIVLLHLFFHEVPELTFYGILNRIESTASCPVVSLFLPTVPKRTVSSSVFSLLFLLTLNTSLAFWSSAFLQSLNAPPAFWSLLCSYLQSLNAP